jgi:hypothetical protein
VTQVTGARGSWAVTQTATHPIVASLQQRVFDQNTRTAQPWYDCRLPGTLSTLYTGYMTSPIHSVKVWIGTLLLLAVAPAAAAPNDPPAAGSVAFCLFEIPPNGERRQWVNLAHIQYIEQRNDEVRAYFGGGNLGSGHEARIPAKTPEEVAAVLQKMRAEAARCAGK